MYAKTIFFLEEKCLSRSFKLVKWNSTTAGVPWINSLCPPPGKIHFFSHWKKSFRLLCVWDDCLSVEKLCPCGWATLLGDINVCLRPVMSNPNGLLCQKLCHCLGQSHTLNDMLLRAAHWMTHFDRNKLNLVKQMYWKHSNPNCSGNIRDSGTEDDLH